MNNYRFIFAGIVLLVLGGCAKSGNEDSAVAVQDPAEVTNEPASLDVTGIELVEITPGLSMRMLREGSGAVAEAGQTAVVHYTGWLYDESAQNYRGQKFDSSVDRGEHFEFGLGEGRVIRGWDEGVVGMKIGELRELTIAPEMAYGDRQVGGVITPNSTLVFEVELAGLRGGEAEE